MRIVVAILSLLLLAPSSFAEKAPPKSDEPDTSVNLALPPSPTEPRDELRAGRASFMAGDYKNAEATISGLLYPTSRLSAAADLAEAHLLLGAIYYIEGNLARSRREFEEALAIEPTLGVDPLVFSKDTIAYFLGIKEQVQSREQAEKQRAELAKERLRLQGILKNMVVLEKRSYWVNFVPFGAGQFQNGQRKKGVVFLATQATLGGISAGLYGYQIIKYGSGVSPQEARDVNRMRVAQITTGALFWGAVAWGIADSLIHYEHVVSRQADPSLLRDLEEEDSVGSLKPRISPMVSESSLGAAFSVRF